jgi:Glycosyltransferase
VRIALVTDCYWPRVNGVCASVQTVKDELLRRGHDVLVLCPEYPDSWGPSPKEEGVRRFASAANAVSKEDRLISAAGMPAFYRALDRFMPDVIHINTEFTANIAARLYAHARGYPILVTSHTDYEDYICNYIRFIDRTLLRAMVRFLMRSLYRSADVIICPTRNQQRKLRAYHIRKRIIVVPTGVPGSFSPVRAPELAAYRAQLDARFPALAGKKVLLFAGRVTIEKDAKFLIPVLKLVLAERKDVALLFAGDGPARPALEASAKRSGLAPHCAFMGYVDRSELRMVYAAADVFVLPSKTETQGLCTIEAMASGTPVVAIGAMGTIDVMQGDNGGFMVGDDQRAFADAVLRLLGDPALRERKAKEAIAWARRFSIETTTTRLERLYKVVAAKHDRLLRLRSGIR